MRRSGLAGGEAGGDLEGVEGVAGVAAGVGGDGGEGVVVGGEAGAPRPRSCR